MKHQMDVQKLINRVIFIEYSLTHLFEDYQLVGLQCRRPSTVKEVRDIRMKFETFEEIEESMNELQSQK